MFKKIKKSFFIISLLYMPSFYAIDEAGGQRLNNNISKAFSIASKTIQAPFSYVYKKLNKYHYTFRSRVKEQNKNFSNNVNWTSIQNDIKKGSDINCKIENQKTLLMITIDSDLENIENKRKFNFLLQNGARINDCDADGETPLSMTFRKILANKERYKHKQTFEKLLSNKANIDCTAKDEKTLLMLAIDHAIDHPNDENFIDYLLKNRASIYCRNTNKSYSPLSYAVMLRKQCKENNEKEKEKSILGIIEYLLSRKAEPKTTIEGVVLLDFAKKNHDKALKNLLIRYDAKPNNKLNPATTENPS